MLCWGGGGGGALGDTLGRECGGATGNCCVDC